MPTLGDDEKIVIRMLRGHFVLARDRVRFLGEPVAAGKLIVVPSPVARERTKAMSRDDETGIYGSLSKMLLSIPASGGRSCCRRSSSRTFQSLGGTHSVCANDVTALDAGFAVDTNRGTIVERTGQKEDLPLMSKRAVADEIRDRAVSLLKSS